MFQSIKPLYMNMASGLWTFTLNLSKSMKSPSQWTRRICHTWNVLTISCTDFKMKLDYGVTRLVFQQNCVCVFLLDAYVHEWDEACCAQAPFVDSRQRKGMLLRVLFDSRSEGNKILKLAFLQRKTKQIPIANVWRVESSRITIFESRIYIYSCINKCSRKWARLSDFLSPHICFFFYFPTWRIVIVYNHFCNHEHDWYLIKQLVWARSVRFYYLNTKQYKHVFLWAIIKIRP